MDGPQASVAFTSSGTRRHLPHHVEEATFRPNEGNVKNHISSRTTPSRLGSAGPIRHTDFDRRITCEQLTA